jgi:hypothetical protein
VSDAQAERSGGEKRTGLRLWVVVLVALVAGAAGGLMHACWVGGELAKETESGRGIREGAKSDPPIIRGRKLPVTSEELGMLGAVQRITFPPGYKVRVIRRMWCNGEFVPGMSGDEYVRAKDANATGEFSIGLRTFDSSALYRDANRLIRVTLYDPDPSLTYWGRLGARGGMTSGDGATGTNVLEARDVGTYVDVMTITYGESAVSAHLRAVAPSVKFIWTRIPAAADLKEADLFAGIWVRLEKLTPEDQTAPWSGYSDGALRRPAAPDEPVLAGAATQEARPREAETKP